MVSFIVNTELNGNEMSQLVRPMELITNVEHYFNSEFIYKDSLDELTKVTTTQRFLPPLTHSCRDTDN